MLFSYAFKLSLPRTSCLVHQIRYSFRRYGGVGAKWKEKQFQRDFLDSFAKKFDLKDWTDWYSVSSEQLRNNGGQPLIALYGDIQAAITSIYAEHPWKIYEFNRVSSVHWREPSNVRRLFDQLFDELRLKTFEDWYTVAYSSVKKIVPSLFEAHSGSLANILMAAYPEHPWEPERFRSRTLRLNSAESDSKIPKRRPSGFWKSVDNRKNFLEDMAERLNLRSLEDWYEISTDAVVHNGGGGLIFNCGTLHAALASVYPQHPWDPLRFRTSMPHSTNAMTKSQNLLFQTICKMFPSRDVLTDWTSSEISDPNRNTRKSTRQELDIFVPSLSLAFEFQGKQHYQSSPGYRFSSEPRERDRIKQLACKQAGITLIEVPYWWDGSSDSLIATIIATRPDIASELNILR
eukprot:TRINITY_DN1724_c0_g1_i1.p1 TRINITY_DN1724_c0_g1~~TRINITY_DN1724_c0_g1_i1.p1  ORF type:complete len:404 (+),score=49.64 TRINITY_DN1724_c0_g1_i1:149-1360(+)